MAKRYLFVVILLAMPALLGAEQSHKPAKWTTEMLLNLAIMQHSIVLDFDSDSKGCKSAWITPTGKTMGDYIAHTLSLLDTQSGGSGVTSECKAVGMATDAQCELMFRTGVGTDSPWSYGVAFTIRNGKIDPRSVTCPGAS